MLHDVLSTLAAWSQAHARAAVATVVQVHGSAPLPVGTIMAVREDGAVVGAVSGGCVEEQVIAAARAVAAGGRSERLRFAPNADPLADTALPCGGGIDVLVEAWGPSIAQTAFADAVLAGRPAVLRSEAGRYAGVVLHEAAPPRRLVLVGAGLLASAVGELARSLGWAAVVIDPREEFVARAATRSGGGAGVPRVIPGWPSEALAAESPLGPADALVVLSHHPALDDEALVAGLASEVGFIGALGSRRTHAERLERLRARGLSEPTLARVAAPVGLDLGGWSAREVAVSIIAELIAVGHGRSGGRLGAERGRLHALPAGTGDAPAPAATQGSLRHPGGHVASPTAAERGTHQAGSASFGSGLRAVEDRA